MIEQIVFGVTVLALVALFAYQTQRLRKAINLGKDKKFEDNKRMRMNRVLMLAFGQQKMFKRPIPAILHAFVYVGFLVINFEVLEIMIDGIFGLHRSLSFLGVAYDGLMAVNEVLALLVVLACIIFLIRRNVIKTPRFDKPEMKNWPKLDGNIILFVEITLMFALFAFNITDIKLSEVAGTDLHGAFPISNLMKDIFGSNIETLAIIGRTAWWIHIVGILLFLNYLPISKHFHIILAFPNTYFSKTEPKGQLSSPENITNEIKLLMNPDAMPPEEEGEMERFGAKDVSDLSWNHILNSFTCTECGRCTDVCPANKTGKLLSPRKIMMNIRDRSEDLLKLQERNAEDDKSLLFDYITEEELWACTTCNACVEACPVLIDPLTPIVELRRYLVMEETKAPQELNIMFNNMENNGAPWAMPATARFQWADGLNIPTMAELMSQGKTADILFWVGCAGAFDDRAKKITKAFAGVLKSSGVNFGVLGNEETCTGDSAKRAGNEFLFQMQAMTNIETFEVYGVKKIVTTCPHCFNTLKNEYPALGGNYELIHHTTFLDQLMKENKIPDIGDEFKNKSVTFHDSCYLGRANEIYDSPRNVLESLKAEVREMPSCKENGLCCGAGGSQMFKESENGTKEINIERTEEALTTNAEVIATSCPFCMTMMADGVKNKEKEQEVKVLDIAELVYSAQNKDTEEN